MRANRTVLEFLIHYLANDSLRKNVFYREMTNMQTWGLSFDDATILKSLLARRPLPNKGIYDLLQEQLTNTPPADLTEMIKRAMEEVGFKAETAFYWIHGPGKDTPVCGDPPEPSASLVHSAVAAGAYGEGEVHVRGLQVLNPPHANEYFTVVVRGQGFGPGVAVRFVRFNNDGTITTMQGSVTSHYANVDVHQYLNVEVALPAGHWGVEVLNDLTGAWTEAACGIIVPS